MPLVDSDHQVFKSILPPASILTTASPDFAKHSVPWSLSYDLQPSLVLAPNNVEELQKLVKYLCDSDKIEFAVRGTGIGNASARDVLISMEKFNGMIVRNGDQVKSRYNVDRVVYIGAGLDWGQVDSRLAELAPGYVVVGARCPYVGVTGSTLMGGLSWLSHELGMGSDPSNMLDAHIVLADGRALWASDEPDLLWALRGGGGNFGIVTELCLRAHPSPSTIFSGMVFYPASALPALSRGLAKWAHSPQGHDPKTAMHIFVFDFTQKTLHGVATTPQLVSIIFDANGEDHARSSDGFQWALDIEGVREEATGVMQLRDVHELQRSTQRTHGTVRSWFQAALITDDDIVHDEEAGVLGRMWKWFEDVKKETPEVGLGTFALLEIMQEATFETAGSPAATAWPHSGRGRQHVLQLGVGGSPEDGGIGLPKLRDSALRVLSEAPARITARKVHPPGAFLPNFLLDNHDLSQIFEGNWEKLRSLKSRYDPACRFKTGPFIPPL